MFHVYLPMAQISVHTGLLIGLGAAVGYLSGMFGIGGGFLLTPLLIFSGIPAEVAISTGATYLIATSMSGVIAQWRRRNVDLRMGGILLIGGSVGSVAGVFVVRWLRQMGQFDLAVSIGYVVLLGIVGSLMLAESMRALYIARSEGAPSMVRQSQPGWIRALPFKIRFNRSRLYASVIPPLVLGFLVAILSAVMGVGGGFIMVPAMIYFLRIPTHVVVGTSLLQIMFVMSGITVLHATTNHTVDIVLAMLLIAGGVFGAQYGAVMGRKLRGEHMRALLAVMVLTVCLRLAYDLVVGPDELFSLVLGREGGS